MKKITKKRAFIQLSMWAAILIGIIIADPLYSWLFSHNLTQTNPLSLFDVVEIVIIIFLLYITNGLTIRLETTEKRLNDIHQELSIRLSTKK